MQFVKTTYNLPAGSILLWGSASLPFGYLACDGTAISRAIYADLFSAIGVTWGSGDGSTTFNLPDFRAAAPVGVGTSTGFTTNETAALATKSNDSLQGHFHGDNSLTVDIRYLPVNAGSNYAVPNLEASGGTVYTPNYLSDGTHGTPRVGTVTKGKTIGVYYIIKYLPQQFSQSKMTRDNIYSTSINYTVLDNDGYDVINVTTGASNITITLPLVANNVGRILTISKMDTGSGTIIVDGAGSETINESLTQTLFNQYNTIKIESNGTFWVVVTRNFEYIIAQSILTGNAQTIDFTGLAIAKNEFFEIKISAIQGAASIDAISLYVNNDTTATNYYYQYTVADNGTTSLARINASLYGAGYAGYSCEVMGELCLGYDGYLKWLSRSNYNQASAITIYNVAGAYKTAITAITQLALKSTNANGFGAGTKVSIIKKLM